MGVRGVVTKVLAGDEFRKSRFHDEKGNFVGIRQFADLPQNVIYFIQRQLLGKYPQRPWVTFNAHRRIQEILKPSDRMIEFGSGMSTLWFARHVAFLQSIEHDTGWYEKIQDRLSDLKVDNVRYELRTLENYADVSDCPDETVDFCVVDGALRAECMRSALRIVKPGGYVYLDNSDKDMTIPNGDLRRAEALLLSAVTSGGSVEYFTGFTVGSINTHQGLLARLPVNRVQAPGTPESQSK